MKHILLFLIAFLLSSCTAGQKVKENIPFFPSGEPSHKDGKFIERYLSDNEIDSESEKTEQKPAMRSAIDYDLVESKELTHYLNNIKDRLLAHWPWDVDHDISIYVTTNRSFNAYSTPWDIVVSWGVLRDVSTEDELAFIIGHELSHILLKHHDVPNYFKKQGKILDFLSNSTILAVKIDDMKVVKHGDKITIEQQNLTSTKRKMTEVYKLSMAVNSLSNDVISSMMNRENEKEADLLGIDLVAKAGYNVSGYVHALNRIESSLNFTKEQLKRKKEKYRNVVTVLSSGEIPEGGVIELLAYNAANELGTNLLQWLAKNYYKMDKRMEHLANYIAREYQTETTRMMKLDEVKRVTQSGESGILLDRYDHAFQAFQALKDENLKEAEKHARLAVSSSTSGHSYPRRAFSLVRETQGNLKKAAGNLNLIKNWETASYKTVLKASSLNRKRKQYDKALKVLIEGGKALGAETYMYPEMITVYRKAGKIDQVNAILTRCRTHEDIAIRKQCRQAAGETVPVDKNENQGSELLEKLQNILTGN